MDVINDPRARARVLRYRGRSALGAIALYPQIPIRCFAPSPFPLLKRLLRRVD